MNICYFAHHSISGKDGASLSMQNIAEEMSKRGNNVYVIYPNHPIRVCDDSLVHNIYIRSFSMRRMLNDTTIRSAFAYKIKYVYNRIVSLYLYIIMKKYNIDIVHINGIDSELGAQMAKKMHVPYIWHIRQFLEEDLNCTPFNKKRLYQLMKKSAVVIGISKAVCKKYEAILNRKVELVYNGVDLDKYEIQKHAFTNSSEFTMILPGRITKEKGQFDAVQAVKVLKGSGKNVKLLLVGYGVDSYFDEVVTYVNDNNLTNEVKFVEYTDNLKSLREKCDIGLVCSVKEAFGRVTVENFLGRLLCIGADTGGTAELINDKRNGLLYKSGDISSLVSCIEYAIDTKNKKAVYDMIDKAFIEAKKMYTTARLIEDLEYIYNVLANNMEER